MSLRCSFLFYVLACLTTLSTQSHARSGDSRQPLHVEADTAEFNDNTGISVYHGSVRITQGTMVLTGDVVTVTAPNQHVKKIVSEGQLATFHQLTDDDEAIDAESEYMEYNAITNKIILLKKATMTQAGHTIASERIEYNTITKIVDAGDPKTGHRVKMTITPEATEPDL
jgi:lipopolysaccharide export system protein LptA